MQGITKKEILPRVILTHVGTGKFKTSCMSVNLITQLSSDSAAKNALLPRVLRRGTAKHPDLDALSRELNSLYGAELHPLVRKKGEMHCIGFITDFIDDEYAGEGENLLGRTAALIGEMLLSPFMQDGLFSEEYVASEKVNLIDDIRSSINDKRQYAGDRLLELMCEGEDYANGKYGSEAAVNAITAKALTEHYNMLIGTSRIEVIYCGSADAAHVEAAVAGALSALPRTSEGTVPRTNVTLGPKQPEMRVFTEALDVSQGKLSIGFRMGECMNNPNYAAIMVFNSVFGGAVTSKLFTNVREKLSLCYYASSAVDKHKGIMTVSSGIEFDKFDAAKDEILAQLDAVKHGDISDFELQSAKRAVMTSIKSTLDSSFGTEVLYFDYAAAGISVTPDELVGLVGNVTKDDVIKVAAGVKTDSVYFLKAKEGGSNDA